MNRVVIGVLICAAVFACAHRPASAMMEFCPATLEYGAVGQGSNSSAPSATYGFALTALGPRTVTTATLAFDTSGGWYTTDVPAMALIAKNRHYSNRFGFAMHRDYVSPTLYIRFPQALAVTHAWVHTITVQNDGSFGWQAQGNVLCDPPASSGPAPEKPSKDPYPQYHYTPDSADEDRLSDGPSPTSLIIEASKAKPLESSDCPEPFRDATVTKQAQPFYPYLQRNVETGVRMTEVEVAINPDGKVLNAWVRITSGIDALDQSSSMPR